MSSNRFDVLLSHLHVVKVNCCTPLFLQRAEKYSGHFQEIQSASIVDNRTLNGQVCRSVHCFASVAAGVIAVMVFKHPWFARFTWTHGPIRKF